jgi:predicted nucleotidyltransferase
MAEAPKLDEVIAILKAHEASYRAKGVTRLAVFGSVARGDAGPDSDVDLVIDYDPDSKFSLLTLVGLELDAADWLGRKVDVVSRCGLKPRLASSVERDGVDVFHL